MTSGFDDYAGNYDSSFFPRVLSPQRPLETRLARAPQVRNTWFPVG